MAAKRITILVDGHTFDGVFQGSRTYLRGLYGALSASDQIEVHVAACDVPSLREEFSGSDGPIRFVQLPSGSRARRLLFEFPRLMKTGRFDYAHFNYVAPLIRPCRTIVTIHDVLFLDHKEEFSWLYRQRRLPFMFAAHTSDILTTVSDYSRCAIARHLNVSDRDIHIIKPGLDAEFLSLASESDTIEARRRVRLAFGLEKFILYVSRIEPRKNHELLLQAHLELRLWEAGVHLAFVGSAAIRNTRLEKMVAAATPEQRDSVHWLGAVDRYLLRDLYKSAAMLVYPSHAEGFGYPPIEAGALGVETLLSTSGSLREFRFFENRFFDPRKIDELKAKIMDVLRGAGSLRPMNEIAKEVRREFTWQRTAEKMERVILEDFRTA